MPNRPPIRRLRLDQLVVQHGIAESRELAKRMIMAGDVVVNGEIVVRPSASVDVQANISARSKPRYVSRGGDKLEKALSDFDIDPTGWVCADIGASSGGFTDCLLQHGANRVYAIDVGHGQLAWSLRQDSRVVILERTNARYLSSLAEKIDLVTVDASFISLDLLLPVACGWLKNDGMIVALIKPQFEAGKGQVGKGGVVRDRVTHEQAIRRVINSIVSCGMVVAGLIPSPLRGPAGNIEFLIWAVRASRPIQLDPENLVETVVALAHEA